MKLGIFVLLSLLFIAPGANSQVVRGRALPEKGHRVSDSLRRLPLRSTPKVTQKERWEIFQSVQRGISRGDAAMFAKYFGAQVYISLRDNESGVFSSSQAFYLLSNFFSLHRPIGFEFTTFGDSDDGPYATGGGTIVIRGVRERIQVYVSLSHTGSRWVIAQLNIY